MRSPVRVLSRVAIACSIVLASAWITTGSASALPPEGHSQEVGRIVQYLSAVAEQRKIEAALDNLGRFFAALAAEEARVAAEEARVAAAIPVDWARWQRLHQCEQPNTWYANGTNAAAPDGLVFQGGLGMSIDAWRMAVRAAAARGVNLPANALAASPEQQMTAAQAFYDAHGWAWGCDV